MSQKLISKVKTMGVYGDVNTFFRLNIHLIRVRNKERKDSTTKAKVVNTKAWWMWFLRCKQPCTVRSLFQHHFLIINKTWNPWCYGRNRCLQMTQRSCSLQCYTAHFLVPRLHPQNWRLRLNLKHTSVATVCTFLECFRYHKKYYPVSLDLPWHNCKVNRLVGVITLT